MMRSLWQPQAQQLHQTTLLHRCDSQSADTVLLAHGASLAFHLLLYVACEQAAVIPGLPLYLCLPGLEHPVSALYGTTLRSVLCDLCLVSGN